MLILLSAIAFAGQCYIGSDCYIYHDVADTTYDQVTINVTAENGTIAVPTQNMSNQADTLYFINFNPEFSGNYTAYIEVLNASVQQSNTTKEFTVLASGGLFTNMCPSTTGTTLTLWLFIAFFTVMAVIGFSTRLMVLAMVGGLGIVFASFIVIGCSTPMGILVLASGLFMAIWSLFLKV